MLSYVVMVNRCHGSGKSGGSVSAIPEDYAAHADGRHCHNFQFICNIVIYTSVSVYHDRKFTSYMSDIGRLPRTLRYSLYILLPVHSHLVPSISPRVRLQQYGLVPDIQSP